MRNDELDSQTDHRFACNICFEQVSEPVVTRCGHLYCWSCLFQWLEPGMTLEDREYLSNTSSWRGHAVNSNRSRRLCPVCKADCSVLTVIPIYVREEVLSTSEVQESSEGDKFDDVDDVDDIDWVEEIQEEIPVEATVSQPMQQHENGTIGIRRRRNNGNSPSRNNADSLTAMPLSQEEEAPNFPNEVPSRPRQPPARSPVSAQIASAEVRNMNRGSANVVLQLHELISTLQSEHNSANQNTARSPAENSTTPSLHNRQQNRNITTEWNAQNAAPVESATTGLVVTTDLLSRILLILGSFVLLCLLVF